MEVGWLGRGENTVRVGGWGRRVWSEYDKKTFAAMSRDEAEEQTARRVTEGKMGQGWALNLEEWQGDTRHWPGTL